MVSFSIVICSSTSQTSICGKSILKKMYEKIIGIFKKQDYNKCLKEIKLTNDITVYLMKLPYTVNELVNLGNGEKGRINKFISTVNSINCITGCIIPDQISDTLDCKEISYKISEGKYLFKALMLDIMDKIFTKRGKEIFDLDITIIKGEKHEDLLQVITLLSPLVKYITVLTDFKDSIDCDIEKIFDETGLAIRVTSDYKSGLKNADLIINLGGLNELNFNSRINSKGIMLNYGELGSDRLTSENIVINGIEVRLPEEILAKLDKDVFTFFQTAQLAEILLLQKNCIENTQICDFSNESLMKIIAREFNDAGYKISGFIGRHNVLKIREVPISGQKNI